MYKTAARWMIRRSIDKLNKGDYQPILAMFADDATLSFPGDNSWAHQYRRIEPGREPALTHRGKVEIEGFLRRYVGEGIHMVVDDILVNGPPWNTRAAARVHHWIGGPDGRDVYANRAVLFVTTKWGKIRSQEDYEDTELVASFDRLAASRHQ
jgi:ketosteroid isomerase-like protein